MKRARDFTSGPGRPWILYGDSHRIVMFAMTVLFAVVSSGSGIAATVDLVSIASDGDVARGVVVAARYGSKGDFVAVRLDPPLDRQVYLRAWSGRPAVGSDLPVRYKRGDPGRAIDARLRWPWTTKAWALCLGAAFAVIAWGVWRGTWYGDLIVEWSRPQRWRRR